MSQWKSARTQWARIGQTSAFSRRIYSSNNRIRGDDAMIRALFFTLLLCATLPAQAALDLVTWGALLGRAVSDGQVDYRQWRDNSSFDALVEQVATTDISGMSREETLVFYINAYNILAARGILDGSAPSSLWGRYTYFKRDKYTVAGGVINLHELEHQLIRPLGESRIHFAIVCASQSCPVLRDEAYTLARLDQQLDDAARIFINDPRRNRFEIDSKRAEISSIFDWFEEDFDADAGSVQGYLARYIEDQAIARLLSREQLTVNFLDYDWSLNGVK